MDVTKGLNPRQISAWLERYSWWLGGTLVVISIFGFGFRSVAGMVFWVLALICMWWPALVKQGRAFLDARPDPDGEDGNQAQRRPHD